MGQTFDVFDIFGRYLGRVVLVPAGLGCLGIILLIPLAIANWLAGFPTAAERRQIEQDRQEGELARAEMQLVIVNPEEYFSLERVRGPVDMPGCGSGCNHLSFGEYRLTNRTDWIGPALNSQDWLCREPSDKGRIAPGETLTIYCVEQDRGIGRDSWTTVRSCITLGQPWEEFQYTMCTDPIEFASREPLSSLFEFDVWIAEDDCGGVCPGRMKSYARIKHTGTGEELTGRFYAPGNSFLQAFGVNFELAPGEEKHLDMNFDLSGYGELCADISAKGYEEDTVCVELPP